MSQNDHQDQAHNGSIVPLSKGQATSRFAIDANAETPIKDAIKISLITLTAVFVTILSLSAFVNLQV